MTMTDLRCYKCDKPLSGGLDTFGAVGAEMCWDCYAATNAGETHDEDELTWYGLAPHHHDLSRTGGIIGSTVFDPLPPMRAGEIDLGDVTFIPDREAGGMAGIYHRKIAPGWR